MAKPADVNDAEWDQEVLKSQLPVLVDFWAPWCGRTACKYGIRSIPTLLVFKDGQIVDQLIGFRPKSDLKRSLEKALS